MRGRARSLDRMDKKPGEGFSYIWVSNKALKWLGQRYPNISPACLPCSLSTRCPFPQHKTLLGCIVGFHRDSWKPCVINGVDHVRLQIICKRLCCMLPRYLENSRRLRFLRSSGNASVKSIIQRLVPHRFNVPENLVHWDCTHMVEWILEAGCFCRMSLEYFKGSVTLRFSLEVGEWIYEFAFCGWKMSVICRFQSPKSLLNIEFSSEVVMQEYAIKVTHS